MPHASQDTSHYGDDRAAKRRRAMRLLELLLAAGYAPAVYHGVPLPAFLRRGAAAPGAQAASAAAPAVVEELDPFEYLAVGPLPGQVEERSVQAAALVVWSCFQLRQPSLPAWRPRPSAITACFASRLLAHSVFLFAQAGVPGQRRQLEPCQPPLVAAGLPCGSPGRAAGGLPQQPRNARAGPGVPGGAAA